MKKLFIILFLTVSLFAFKNTAIKILAKNFSKNTLNTVIKLYGEDGLKALQRLSVHYGKAGLKKLEIYSSKYGKDGLIILSRYDEKALANRATFELVKKFGQKGYYLIQQYPVRSVKYYEKYGDKFVKVANEIGNGRVIHYMDCAAKYGKDDKILKFLDKYGEKGDAFLNKHWGKLLISGFVLLNDDSLVESAKNIANHIVDKSTGMIERSVKDVANSQIGWFIGIALLLFVFFNFGVESLIRGYQQFQRKSKVK